MKFVISFCFILATGELKASPVHIYYEDQLAQAFAVRKIFVEKYHLPEEIISLRKINRCQLIEVKGKLDLCINENGDLNVVSVDQRFISESLKVFQEPKRPL